ncbi:hypothetical protein [Streptomyces rimosus]|uniref:hypothetical protein n=1 Tax=Streptomyces rimosus TaxID=1927 RepID=UPI00131E845B|nr:hypothetical protein [Streptomyces rimosus]
MVSKDTPTHEHGQAEGSAQEATSAPTKSRHPATNMLALTAAVSLAVGGGVGYAVARMSSTANPATSGRSTPAISGIDQKNACKIVSSDMQRQLSVVKATPMSEDKGAASCYLMMTEEGATDPAGFVVAFYPTAEALQQTVDGTNAIPEKAEPLMIGGRAAARQVLYGETWKAQLTVDLGNGATLYIERFGPKDSLSQRELRRSVDDLASSVLQSA